MELKIQKIIKFKTPDQKEFDNETSARNYMRDKFIRDQLNTSLSQDFPISQELSHTDNSMLRNKIIDMVTDYIVKHKSIILNLFNNTDSIKVE